MLPVRAEDNAQAVSLWIIICMNKDMVKNRCCHNSISLHS
jgi:hypothetical protein